MKILNTELMMAASKGTRTFLSLWKRTFEWKGRESDYFMVTRGTEIVPFEQKRPDAVVIVALYRESLKPHRLVTTSEYRVPLGARELGFPAGLIDAKDFENAKGDVTQAAKLAAIREMKEETGFDFLPIEVSPANLYSSAGLTNESVTIVLGYADGTCSNENCEHDEDISVNLLTHAEVREAVRNPDLNMAQSKTAWPFLWAFSRDSMLRF